ncbi:MAG: dTMP kinase [Anaerolineales bacterium]|nr:dTMP kinase [Anaerolineales bacterium]
MFITFEGPEGSGKTCHIPDLADFLTQEGYEVVVTREPGGTPIGDEIRDTLLKLGNTAMHPTTEILLFQASRAQHVHQLILPAIQAGKIVLCDRFADSTMAYQGYGHQTDLEELARIIRFATGGLLPDLTLLLDVDIEIGLQRRSADRQNWNRLDAKEIAFHQRVRQGYLEMAAAQPERWEIIDASQPLEDVLADIQTIVIERVKKHFT